ncbi:MAG: hypothetical protein LBV69_09045 [Bacteroidales bacterium]|jgi:hypothetical protein|nr:hypothetical protein [Bacteroidales bacterium]
MKKLHLILILIGIVFLLPSCKSKKISESVPNKVNEEQVMASKIPSPPTIVYKTKRDYNNLVPITLSEDKTRIVSYPHPNDLKNGDKLRTPTVLNDGYLLDNRGINVNTAFLSISYEVYSKLAEPLPMEDMWKLIIDDDPFVEICNCGYRIKYQYIEKEINELIENNELHEKCNVIKK